MATISELLARCRERANELRDKQGKERLTQQMLAKMIGVSPTTVRNWETGNNIPGADHLRSLIKTFLQQGGFYSEKEEQQAKELWEEAGRKEAFDEEWFRNLPKSRRRQPTDDEEYRIEHLLKQNPRGITLLHAIESAGLVDIENRDDDDNSLPPREFYKMAKYEIVITGITAHTTIVKHDDELIEALEASKDVYILILYPDPQLVEEMEEREHLKIVTEIQSVIESIQLYKLDQRHNFEIKFMRKIPTFTGVMIDGDVNLKGKTPRDYEGQIRVQPASVYGTHHRGAIFQFKKKIPNGLFDYFAEDIRNQWQKGISLRELLNAKGKQK